MVDMTSKPDSGFGLLTSAPLVRNPHDVLIRRVSSPDTGTQTFIRPTADVQQQLSKWMNCMMADVSQLKGVIRWQHHLIDYNSSYQAYLMDQLSDEEFEEVAEKFAYEPREIDVEQLAAGVERIYSLTGIAYTPSDICSLFQCDHEVAVRAVQRARETYPELSYLLPKEGE